MLRALQIPASDPVFRAACLPAAAGIRAPRRCIVLLDTINNDLTFIIVEVTKQLEDTLTFLLQLDESLVDRICNRDDYIDNLKSRIEDHCFSGVTHSPAGDTSKQTINHVRAINIIGANLERIGDYTVNIVDQMAYLSDTGLLHEYPVKSSFKEVIAPLRLIGKALEKRNITMAMEICRCEQQLDERYTDVFQRIIGDIRGGKNVENRITLLFIFSYLERIGDALLNIGEAIIFAAMGQKLKVHQYKALEGTLASSEMNTCIDNVHFESIWGTQSGCRVGHIHEKNPSGSAQKVIFKKGSNRKLERELQNIEQWEQIVPGLPPKVLAFQKDGRHSSLLIEYLGSTTFQHIMVHAPDELFTEAFHHIQHTLLRVWNATKENTAVNAHYSKQLASRLQDVFSIHPSFKIPERQIGGLSVLSLDQRIQQTQQIDRRLSAPFSVFIHGDFNIDNIIYNSSSGRIHFIDLNRSERSDYVQDTAVFLVSNFRQPGFDPGLRKRITAIINAFYVFARRFARLHGDHTFDARLAIAVARSLITSTRFELNKKFAQTMFLRSIYLLERINEHPQHTWDTFVFPRDVLTY